MKSAAALVLFVVSVFLLILAEGLFFFKSVDGFGVVVGLEYVPARSSTGFGTGFNPNGGPVTVITTEHTPEKWTVIIRAKDEIVSAEAEPGLFYQLEREQCVKFQTSIGRITHLTYSRHIISAECG